jgi:2C-methyl-D-erythritol 2,4-cyclodiphosphate synthase
MRSSLAEALGTDPDRVSVKAKTNEGFAASDRGDAMVAHAIALLRNIRSAP